MRPSTAGGRRSSAAPLPSAGPPGLAALQERGVATAGYGMDDLDREASAVLARAEEIAVGLGHRYCTSSHLLLGLLDPDVSSLAEPLDHAGVHAELVYLLTVAKAVELLGPDYYEPPTRPLPLSPAAKRAISVARELAAPAPVSAGHLLLALVDDSEGLAATALTVAGLSAGLVRQLLGWPDPAR